MIKIDKERLKVYIIFNAGHSLKGFVHIDQGMRLHDFLNSHKDDFLVVTEARVKNSWVSLGICCNKRVVFVNKNSIEFIEECK
jgi:hypothetical protein